MAALAAHSITLFSETNGDLRALRLLSLPEILLTAETVELQEVWTDKLAALSQTLLNRHLQCRFYCLVGSTPALSSVATQAPLAAQAHRRVAVAVVVALVFRAAQETNN
jgi:hypothetical protein